MHSERQEIRFIHSHDGVRLAWTSAGRGPVLVKAATWLTHAEYDWGSPVWGHMLRGLSSLATCVCYDERGCGLSDHEVTDLGFEARVGDLEAMIDALGDAPVALLGIGYATPIAIAYAARHPERVSHLVLHGGYARGWQVRSRSSERQEEFELMARFTELGWRNGHASFHQFMTSQIIPGGTPEQQQWLSDLRRITTTAENAARFIREIGTVDVSALLPLVRCPTLVLHNMHDRSQPSEDGRTLATRIPGARLFPIRSVNHFPLEQEPGWREWLEAVRDFLPSVARAAHPLFDALTSRERELVELLAQGRDNAQIAASLGLAEKTVRNHLTHVFDKLEVDHRGRAIVLARESGFGQLVD